VLDVKPAFEDVDAQIFLAFHCAIVEDQIESNTPKKKAPENRGKGFFTKTERESKWQLLAHLPEYSVHYY